MIKIMRSSETAASELFARTASERDVSGTVAEIIANVRAHGDAALCEYNAKFDRAEGVALEVTAEELDAAVKAVDPEFLRVLERAGANIRAFHERQLQRDYILTRPDGSMLGQRIIPMQRVGLYIPGGTAAYPSSVLMNCIPAKIAGVDEIVMTTPASGGEVSPAILAAAKVAGVDRVFRVGGAQAVAALAYGTETIPRVDKIVGPGNAFVAEAKRQVFGQVAIDMIAGPSEILIVADKSADPVWLAADMLSQAEHDKLGLPACGFYLLLCARGKDRRGAGGPARGIAQERHRGRVRRGKRQDNRHGRPLGGGGHRKRDSAGAPRALR